MIRLFLCNKAEVLGDMLASELTKPVSDAFTPEIIAIQARGMERWISMIIASKTGICANIDFSFPKKIINQIIHAQKGLDYEKSPFKNDILKFVIFRLLENPAKLGDEFEIIRNYCSSDQNGLKRFQLSGHIATAFEKYLFYRPELILKWDSGGDDIWQAKLWRMITSEYFFPHPALLINEFVSKAVNGNLNLELLPKRLNIFGIASLSPSYINVLDAMSGICDVSIFCLSPCMEYWGNLPSISQRKAAVRKGEIISDMHFEQTNDLLESLGESSSDFLELLYARENIVEQDIFVRNNPGGNNNLLSFIQSSMLFLENPAADEDSRHKWDINDDSLWFHSCHSPLRETEVLFDRILDMLEKDQNLSPSDIIVMTPEIGKYGPCIEAVFGSSGGSSVRIPFTVADRLSGEEKKATDCFLSVIRLGKSRLCRHEVLEIIENRCVSAKFEIDGEDLDLIKKWLSDARVSGEMDEKQRISLGLPGFRENTWAHAIDRLLLGIAMQDEDMDSFCGISPLPGIMTSNYAALSKFLGFWSSMTSAINELENKKTVGEWVVLLSNLLDMFMDDSETGPVKRNIRSQLLKLKDIAEKAGINEKTDIGIIAEFLSKELEDSASSYGFLTGGITFCAMLPMRSIPFRVICLLGMNNDSFPRNENPPGFDLTIESPKPGDPSIRKDDRQLFLDIIISAREKLYISYTGQSARDNSIIPPSVLVSELLDYIDGSTVSETNEKTSEKLIIKHPMHGFSPTSFEMNNEKRIFSFNREYFDAASAIISKNHAKKEFWEKELPFDDHLKGPVSLADLKKFWKNPCEYAVRYVLGANLDFQDQESEIMGASMPSGLERHLIFSKNMELRQKINNISSRQKILSSQGLLPHGSLGELTQSIYESEADAVEYSVDFASCRKAIIEIDFQIGNFTLNGNVNASIREDETGSKLIFVRYGSINPANILLSAWIDFLACRMAGCEADSFVLAGFGDSKTKRSVSKISSSCISVDEAEKHLQEFLKYYQKGLMKPLHFLPDTSRDYAAAVLKNKETKALYSEIEKRLSGFNSSIEPGFYENLCFGDDITDLFFNSEEFKEIAVNIFTPVILATQEVK
ncbi:exodeoxyribonuclease V subunit gamma [Desulforegula conservatrix]|uniref:exodeoxyribonuclease V subunit gamma n=1 Tax=Desulforegula conservatrix TaxID=153026 RepID=UPI000404A4D1|nr:exodeoxyribonuclease V subunit gamma [Desulforegula conservatrix]